MRLLAGKIFAVALCCLLSGIYAAPSLAASVADKQRELKDVKGRIELLGRDLAKSQEKHSDASEQLREVETKISDATRKLRALGADRAKAQAQLFDLEAQVRKLDGQTARQQAQLGRMLRNQFIGNNADSTDALQSMLTGRDPNAAARDEYFLRALSLAKAELIRELQAATVEKKHLAASALERKESIVQIQKHEQESTAELIALRGQRRTALAGLAGKIKAQRSAIDRLKSDEQRLAKLIEGFGKSSRKSTARASGDDKAGNDRNGENRDNSDNSANSATRPAGKRPPTSGKPSSSRKSADADPGALASTFGQLRGKLPMPVAGNVSGRFGGAREEGGSTWKGIFIRAAEGAEVRAVASGIVVFSEWMRGFGNLLVVNHDDDFFSIYGFNETLLAQRGERVSAGSAISTVGNSGRDGDDAPTGLYFELRHKGLPFDPQKWISGGKK